MEFDLIGIDVAFANCLRRVIISEVIFNNVLLINCLLVPIQNLNNFQLILKINLLVYEY